MLLAQLIDMEDRMAEGKPKQARNEKKMEDTRVVALVNSDGERASQKIPTDNKLDLTE